MQNGTWLNPKCCTTDNQQPKLEKSEVQRLSREGVGKIKISEAGNISMR
nr:MAG TPA: hypothetical protein [Caudoviricetes sp.]